MIFTKFNSVLIVSFIVLIRVYRILLETKKAENNCFKMKLLLYVKDTDCRRMKLEKSFQNSILRLRKMYCLFHLRIDTLRKSKLRLRCHRINQISEFY